MSGGNALGWQTSMNGPAHLERLLQTHAGAAPVILIDEYHTFVLKRGAQASKSSPLRGPGVPLEIHNCSF